MPATFTFPILCARLNRPTVYVRGLQTRFALPTATPTNHITARPVHRPTVRPLISDLRPLANRLWTMERKLMQLLHADSTGSPTWFLDSCISTTSPLRTPHSALRTSSHRLLLSNFDIGASLPSGAVQTNLNFTATTSPELFSAPEMGDDALLVLNQYLPLHQQILHDISLERPILRAALRHFQPHP